MTKKNYEAAVIVIKQEVRNAHPGVAGTVEHALTSAFADFFQADNARFDRERFTLAVKS